MRYLLIVFLSFVSFFGFAQENDVVRSDIDLRIFSDYVSKYAGKKELPGGTLLVETGKYFLGSPYVSGTLEQSTPEKLIVNLRAFDCTTFVETCLALSRMLKNEAFDAKQPIDKNFEIFTEELRKIRYRDGKIDEYPSRLHYFSDWIYNNQKKGIVTDVTSACGGISFLVETGFMSKNPDKYAQLKNNSLYVAEIVETEISINARNYYYIPKANISKRKSLIQSGDIIAFTTSIPGLDVSHVGLAVWKKNELYLLHASLTEGKAVLSSQPLSAYTHSIKRHTGVMVARPIGK